MKEFNLSEKRTKLIENIKQMLLKHYKGSPEFVEGAVMALAEKIEEQDKEFIRLLKPWCKCGHLVEEHVDRGSCAGCPCEKPEAYWYSIEDLHRLAREKLIDHKLFGMEVKEDKNLKDDEFKLK